MSKCITIDETTSITHEQWNKARHKWARMRKPFKTELSKFHIINGAHRPGAEVVHALCGASGAVLQDDVICRGVDCCERCLRIAEKAAKNDI